MQFHTMEMENGMAQAGIRQAPASRKPGASPGNRSLERGIEILRAFRPGSEWLGNGELAERSGLPPSTVSRLAQTLVRAGYLERDPDLRMFRLGAPVLSLAHAMYTGSSVLQVATPLMRSVAARLRINVGLAVPDRYEMVYLESIRYNRKASLRSVVSGQRIPMELTSLGRAYLAVAPEPEREELLKNFALRRGAAWKNVQREISDASDSVRTRGYCTASWQPEVVALATPVVIERRTIYCLNFSVSSEKGPASVAAELADPLLKLAEKIRHAIIANRSGNRTGSPP